MHKNMATYSSGTARRKLPAERREELEQSQSDDVMMKLSWFHPYLTRHTADCMLIDNAPEGSYLLRPSSEHLRDMCYVLSVKLSSSVQHIKITRTEGRGFKFGNSTFQTLEAFRRHFEKEKPIIGGDSGITVVLQFPYSRMVKETHIYTDVVHHAVTNMIDSTSDSDLDDSSTEERSTSTLPISPSINSKEGYLTKQGMIRKNWKTRWFILRNNTLSYYKSKLSAKPISRLDISQAGAVEYDNSKEKEYCFRIELPHRTFYMHAGSAEDCDNWVELLRSKLS